MISAITKPVCNFQLQQPRTADNLWRGGYGRAPLGKRSVSLLVHTGRVRVPIEGHQGGRKGTES